MIRARSSIAVELLRAGLAGVAILLLARSLGPANYGIWSGGLAVVLIASPVITAGAQYYLPAAVRSDMFGAGTAIRIARLHAWAALAMAPALAAVVAILVPSLSYVQAVLLVLSELVLSGACLLISAVWLSTGELSRYRRSSLAPSVARLTASAAFLWLGDGNLQTWLYYSVAAMLAVSFSTSPLRGGAQDWRYIPELRRSPMRGGPFLATSTVGATVDNADKYLVLKFAGEEEAGRYALAYRLSAYALVPARGIALSYFPKFFSAVGRGSAELRHLAMTSAGIGTAVTVMTGAAVSSGVLLGQQFLFPEYGALASLSLIIVLSLCLRPLHYAFGDALYALGTGLVRALTLLAGAAVTLPVLAWLTLLYGASGAALGLVLSEGVIVLCLGLQFVLRMGNRGRGSSTSRPDI